VSVFGLDITYSVRGQQTSEPVFQKMALAFERAGAALEKAGEHVFPKLIPVFEAELSGQFNAQGKGPNRGAWAALSSDYASWKSQHYPGKPILEATGKMKAALTQSSSPFAERSYSESGMNFGTQNVPYASYHQLGTGRMPDRPIFDFGSGFEEALDQAARAGVREAVKASKLDDFAEVNI
jgi:phage gpG-like protein